MGQRIYYEGAGGRISVIAHTIDTTYWAYRAYDAFGRAGTQSVNAVFATRNVYNSHGHLAEVRRDADNSLLLRADLRDAEGRVTRETLGNGVVTDRAFNAENGRLTSIQANGPNGGVQDQTYAYDSLGNLTARSDAHLASNEVFVYDALNRLTSATSGSGTVSVQYDALGNILHKSDVGAYTYGGRPHAVTQAGAHTYTYDANGNALSGAGRTLAWTSYNLPHQITEAGATTTFLYDYNHVRAYQVNGGKTVVYLNPRIDLGGHFNKETAGGVVTESYYFYAGGKVAGAYVTKTGAPAQTNYFHADHLGSIGVVTDQAGLVIARYQFDPWGKRSLASGSNATIHGYTGHEHLDGGLIHMNGRVYDPVLARFLSADPHIQDPGNLQSWNRYSYVLNNPLAYTDPSGYFSLSKFFKKILRPIVAIAVAWYLGPGGFFGADGVIAGNAFASSLVAGAASGVVSTGNIQGAFQGMLTGGLFYGAGQFGNALGFANDSFGRAVLHASAGCVSASAGGGDCGNGAIPAGFTKFAASNIDVGSGDAAKLVKYSVIGGTASAIGGGKFANGAASGAFQYLFNENTPKRSNVGWMDKSGVLRYGEHPDFQSGKCADRAYACQFPPKESTRQPSRQDAIHVLDGLSRGADYAAFAALAMGQVEGAVVFKSVGIIADGSRQYIKPSHADVTVNVISEVAGAAMPGPQLFKEYVGLSIKEGYRSFEELGH